MQIDLKYPVTVGGETTASVTLRRARGKDMRRLAPLWARPLGPDGNPQPDPTDALLIVSTLTDTPPEVVDEMDMEDVQTIAAAAADFLPGASAAPSGAAS